MIAQRTSAPTGLIAYLPTPVRDDRVDLTAFARLVERATAAGVDGLGVLGSTGAAMHLDRDERRDVVRTAVGHTGLPVVAGISGLRTSLVRAHADDAQAAGAAAVLLAPVGYVPLVGAEVVALFTDVVAGLDVPLVVYDNPGTTRVDMSHGLLAELAALPGVGGIKTPGPTGGPDDARRRVAELRASLPDGVTLGFSGDPSGPAGLLAGADTWHSTVGGALPDVVVPLARAARAGDESVHATVERLAPLWDLVRTHAGVRVAATFVELLGLVDAPSLPRPLLPLSGDARADAARVLTALAG
ncbi:dihydrodipicolinate synthase family protein [Sanguibacter hominis ATCC BAA-789]|uniref:Dihydrodipicolinate synthase family protein n=1 Tax=Sanguibacter hominis ATCC BAA-789 TaxID=1312740 RepID=A0A9X5IQ79_9MICO|nr:dihydrodipicolinate synthase family protein [Sanguibacter hominis]NKX93902.1 dihydrodipicolinate synthase family protein [Sanguibacter hominis ATCC BAA-789]